MPTLLQINTTCNTGSHGRMAEQIGIAALREGYRSVIAYGRGSGTSASETIHTSSRADMYAHALETRLFDRHGLGSRMATSALLRHIDRIAPDIVHLHNIHGYYLNYPQLFRMLGGTGVPVVWTLHDYWAFTGHCAQFTSVGCDRWLTGCHDCPQLHTYPASWIRDRSADNYRDKMAAFKCLANLNIVTVCDHQAGLVRSSMLRGHPIHTIHNGIDLQRFRPIDHITSEKSHKYRLIGVANVWNQWKGFDDFILLRKLLPDSFEIMLVGVTSPQAASLPKGIRGICHVDQEELVRLYSSADLFVNLSHDDTYPTTLLESLACGTPVATYDTGGCREAISESCGIVVPRGDVSAMAAAIKAICETTGSFRRFPNIVCRDYAVANHDQNACTKSYLDLYSKLLQRL